MLGVSFVGVVEMDYKAYYHYLFRLLYYGESTQMTSSKLSAAGPPALCDPVIHGSR